MIPEKTDIPIGLKKSLEERSRNSHDLQQSAEIKTIELLIKKTKKPLKEVLDMLQINQEKAEIIKNKLDKLHSE